MRKTEYEAYSEETDSTYSFIAYVSAGVADCFVETNLACLKDIWKRFCSWKPKSNLKQTI